MSPLLVALVLGPLDRLEGDWTSRETVEEGGMTLTRKDGRMRIVYRWDGPRAYDARLQTRCASEQAWSDRTIARYTKR